MSSRDYRYMARQAYGFVPGSSFFYLFPFITLCRTGQQYTQGKEPDGIGMAGRPSQTGQKWDDAIVLNESVQTIDDLLGHLTLQGRATQPTNWSKPEGTFLVMAYHQYEWNWMIESVNGNIIDI